MITIAWLTIITLYEILLRITGNKFINACITDKDGSTRIVRFRVGKDPEVEALISSIKKRRDASNG